MTHLVCAGISSVLGGLHATSIRVSLCDEDFPSAIAQKSRTVGEILAWLIPPPTVPLNNPRVSSGGHIYSDPISWNGTFKTRGCVFFVNDGGKASDFPLIGCIDFGQTYEVRKGEFKIDWGTSPVFTLDGLNPVQGTPLPDVSQDIALMEALETYFDVQKKAQIPGYPNF